MKRSSFLDNNFRVVFGFRVVFVFRVVLNDEASNTRLLKTFHQDFWIWLLNLSPWRKALTRTVFWWEQVISKLPSQEKLGVASRQNQPISPSLMALDVFGAQMLLVGVMILSIRDSWCSYHQDMKTNCSSFQFLFLIFAVSRNSSFKWYYGSLVFNFLRTSLFCIIEKVFFLGPGVFVFLEIICEEPFQMMKLLILDSWRLSTTVSEFGCWISGISESPSKNCLLMGPSQPNLPSHGFSGAALRQNQPITTFFDGSQFFSTWLLLFLVMVLSMFNSSISCHHSWW